MSTDPDRAAGQKATRADDERLLSAVAMRADGLPHELIASRLGMTRLAVKRLTAEVKRADLTRSGEPRAAVVPAYWGD